MTKTNLKGFTLIELLIVIVIIGILAVALLPRLSGSQKQARDTARKAAVNQVVTAIESYKINNNGNIPGTASFSGDLVNGGYMSSFPLDSKAGHQVQYTASGSEYVVYVALEGAGGNATTGDFSALQATGTVFKAIVR